MHLCIHPSAVLPLYVCVSDLSNMHTHRRQTVLMWQENMGSYCYEGILSDMPIIINVCVWLDYSF